MRHPPIDTSGEPPILDIHTCIFLTAPAPVGGGLSAEATHLPPPSHRIDIGKGGPTRCSPRNHLPFEPSIRYHAWRALLRIPTATSPSQLRDLSCVRTCRENPRVSIATFVRRDCCISVFVPRKTAERHSTVHDSIVFCFAAAPGCPIESRSCSWTVPVSEGSWSCSYFGCQSKEDAMPPPLWDRAELAIKS